MSGVKIYSWQQSQWQQLNEQFLQNRLPQALLLQGPIGLGITDFAWGFATFVLCQQKKQSMPCGSCRSCHFMQQSSHPDFYTLFPEGKSQTIKVDAARELIAKLQQTSQQGGYQIALIDPAEAMNRSSANALLKSLEEPVGKVLFLLVSHQTGNIPATILSRTQRLPFSAPSHAQGLAWLTTQLGSANDAALLLHLAENAPLLALELAQGDYLVAREALLQHLMRIRTHQDSPLAFFAKKNVFAGALILQVLQTLLSDILRLQLGAKDDYIRNRDCLQSLQVFAQAISSRAELQQLLQRVQTASQLLQSRAPVNEQLLLEDCFIEWGKAVC